MDAKYFWTLPIPSHVQWESVNIHIQDEKPFWLISPTPSPLPLLPLSSLIVSSVHTKSSGSQRHVTFPDQVAWESQAFWLMEDHLSLITVLKITFWMEISAKLTLFFDTLDGGPRTESQIYHYEHH